MKKQTRPAIFLDRDGTLNRDIGYLHRIEDWVWLPGVRGALLRLVQAGYVLIVVSNQSGIARGFYESDAVLRLHKWVNAGLKSWGIGVLDFYFCPHHPDFSGACECRKPSPNMLLQAAAEHGLDLKRSWMIGDKESDVLAGQAAGCRCILLDVDGDGKQGQDFFSVKDLAAAVDMIV